VKGYGSEVGVKAHSIDTPALLVDLPAMERNIKKMADYFKGVEANLRPHVKIHKATSAIAHMQLAAGGAVGVTCAKLAEAEVIADAGIKDILIANQIVGSQKIDRLVNLASHSDIMVAVESAENVMELSRAAQSRGVQLRVLVEVNIGNNRCGVDPLEPALELSKLVDESVALNYMGLMGYDGHCAFAVEASERPSCARASNKLLTETKRFVEENGLDVAVVSGGGTHTYDIVSKTPGVTEVQAGTYVLMDTKFKESGVDFECALSILASVVSRPQWSGAGDLAIIDVGRKGMDTYWGLPEMKAPHEAELFSVPQEHARLKLTGEARKLKAGDKVHIHVRDANGTFNLYDRVYAVRDGIVEAVWRVGARGDGT